MERTKLIDQLFKLKKLTSTFAFDRPEDEVVSRELSLPLPLPEPKPYKVSAKWP